MNTPSYWLKKPSPMAAPRLGRAGKHAAQPIAVTMAPITPALSAVRVRGLGMDMGMALDASVLNGGGVARIRRGADECLRAGLGIIEGHNGFLLVEQDLGLDRKSVVSGKSVSVRVDFGGRRIIKKKIKTNR